MRISDWSSDVCSSDLGFPQLAAPDVIGDVVNALVAQLAVAKAGDGVIFVKALLRLGGGLDVPFDQRRADGGRDLMRKHRLAGARLALHQQRAAERDRRVHRDLQVLGGDIGRSEEHTSELPSLMRNSYAVFCLKK